jgi:hypothetical protein
LEPEGQVPIGGLEPARALELEQGMVNGLPSDRAAAIEGALSTMAQAIERLTDAQRVALFDRVRTGVEPRTTSGRIGQHNTPA